MIGGAIVRAGLFPLYHDEPTRPEIVLQFLIQAVNATLAMQRDIEEPAGLSHHGMMASRSQRKNGRSNIPLEPAASH